jgi:L-ascorbate metabolism protein UlaG (beta-lactamase superfamily)
MMAAAALVAGCATPGPEPGKEGKIEILRLGQSAMRITTVSGKVIMIDPGAFVISRTEYKSLDALGKIDLILVTHGHPDHLANAPALAKMHNAKVWSGSGLSRAIVMLGLLPADLAPPMNKGGTITPLGPDIRITMTHASHSSEVVWTNPATGKQESHFGGEPVGFIIELENGFKIYHMGDTALFGDMKLIGDYYKPDLIMIPIGGHLTMDPKAAAFATSNFLKPRYAIPMHYGTIPVLAGTPEEYIQALGASSTRVFPANPGDKLRF